NVLGVDDQVFPYGLLESRMELISESCGRVRRNARDERGNESHVAAGAGDNQVLVKWRLQRPRVRDSQHGIALLDVVGDTQPRLHLTGRRQASIDIPANA